MDDSTPVMQAPMPPGMLAFTTFLSLVTFAVQAVCISRRIKFAWRGLTLTYWLILIIYIDSALFVVSSAVLSHGFGLNSSPTVCNGAIIMCLVFYMSSKLIYYFLVEKVYIVTEIESTRLKSKLYCFNCFVMLVPYAVLVIVNFMYRIAKFDANGTCIIGMERQAMIPLVIFDVVVNVYLTALFIMPLRKLHTFKEDPNSALRIMTIRTFVGSCCTLISSLVNLTVLTAFNGEPAWICLMLCSLDILFSVLVLQWVTNRDSSRRKSEVKSTYEIKSNGSVAEINQFHRDKFCKHSDRPDSPVLGIFSNDVGPTSKPNAKSSPTVEKGAFPPNTIAMSPDFSWDDEDV